MRSVSVLIAMLSAGLALAGCFTDGGEGQIDPPRPDDEDGPGPPDGNTTRPPPPGGNNTTPPPAEGTVIDDFSANDTAGEAPLEVEFHLAARSPDAGAEWTVAFGDDEKVSGTVSDLPAHIVHTYASEGDFTATATVEGRDARPSEELAITVIAASEEPAELSFEYGSSLGCFGDIAGTCVSREQGPGAQAIDGHWQGLDARYWGMSFTTTVESQLHDSDCWAVDENMENIDEHLNRGADVCGGVLPEGTKWLFLYPYGEPASGMTLTFGAEPPEEDG